MFTVIIPTSVRYLGHNLDKLLTWNSHIRIKRLVFNTRLRRPRILLTKNKYSRLKVKVVMCKTFFKPLEAYGSSIKA